MKKTILVFVVSFISLATYSQENLFSITGGYVFTRMDLAKVDTNVGGWRITGLYEFNPMGGKLAHGLSFGYTEASDETSENTVTTKHTATSFPIYYAPKYFFGNEKIKGFLKGAVGWQFAKLEVEGQGALGGSVSSTDSGFTFGVGAGGLYDLTDKFFLSAEYEFLLLNNSFYKDETINTLSAGIGLRF